MLTQKYKTAAWLEKFGWKEGQGLGKNETGMADYIRVDVKKDNLGLGATRETPWKNWWENMYDQAAKKKQSSDEGSESDCDNGYTSEDESEEEDKRTKKSKGKLDLLSVCGGARFSQSASVKQTGKLQRVEHQERQYKNKGDLQPDKKRKPEESPAESLDVSKRQKQTEVIVVTSEEKQKKKKKKAKKDKSPQESQERDDEQPKKKKRKKHKNEL